MEADRIIRMFGSRLEPNIFALIFDIQQAAASVRTPVIVFPDIVGIPDDLLPPNNAGQSSVPLKEAMNYQAAEDLREVLHLAQDLAKLVLANL